MTVLDCEAKKCDQAVKPSLDVAHDLKFSCFSPPQCKVDFYIEKPKHVHLSEPQAHHCQEAVRRGKPSGVIPLGLIKPAPVC